MLSLYDGPMGNSSPMFPLHFQVVGYAEMMGILTDYDYIIDYTSDAGGAPEAFGGEAGYGIISAKKMLAWVEANCVEACPGSTASGAIWLLVSEFSL